MHYAGTGNTPECHSHSSPPKRSASALALSLKDLQLLQNSARCVHMHTPHTYKLHQAEPKFK